MNANLNNANTEHNSHQNKEETINYHPHYNDNLMSILEGTNNCSCDVDDQENYIHHDKWHKQISPVEGNKATVRHRVGVMLSLGKETCPLRHSQYLVNFKFDCRPATLLWIAFWQVAVSQQDFVYAWM